MRGYEINEEGLITEVYDVAPKGSKDKYTGESGVYTETAINKLVAQNIRYREFIELKSEKRRLDIDLQDTQDELSRVTSKATSERLRLQAVQKELATKKEQSEKLRREVEDIQREIDVVLGGAI